MRSKKIIYILILFIFLTGCKEKTYTITFNTDGGNAMDSVEVNKGDTIQDVASPTKDGYLFVSWLKDGVEYNQNTPIKEDIYLTAKWIEEPEIYNYYTITFVMEDKVEKTVVKENETVTPLVEPPKENYIFLGWFVGDEKFDFNTPITKDISLTAKYEYGIVTVTYDLDGGFGLALETIPKYSTITIPETPYRKGYQFIKWTLNGEEFSFDTKIDKDITLKAIWSLIEYITINFDTDGGNIINSQTIQKYSQLDNLPIPVKEGYTFVEWQLDSELFNIDTKIEQDITLKAIYKLNEE